ncbi:MAG: DUF3284 domain-containing protein [Erysipelotrichaceae bacterium]|nr:DUF3284 domain-containing protein [Erysipelotrichaceae bacterium]MDD3810444.1 DUF3284 domain-containing protein [Erysipelotrichaceae bacterium]
MKLIRTFAFTSDEFYDFLESDLLANAAKCTSRPLCVNDIKKGFKYSKHDSNAHTRIDVTILDYQRHLHYKSKIKSIGDTITIEYETRNCEQGLEITFNQHFESFESTSHNKFMELFSQAVYLGRMTDTLYDIERKIVKRREGIFDIPEVSPVEHKWLRKLVSK